MNYMWTKRKNRFKKKEEKFIFHFENKIILGYFFTSEKNLSGLKKGVGG